MKYIALLLLFFAALAAKSQYNAVGVSYDYEKWFNLGYTQPPQMRNNIHSAGVFYERYFFSKFKLSVGPSIGANYSSWTNVQIDSAGNLIDVYNATRFYNLPVTVSYNPLKKTSAWQIFPTVGLLWRIYGNRTFASYKAGTSSIINTETSKVNYQPLFFSFGIDVRRKLTESLWISVSASRLEKTEFMFVRYAGYPIVFGFKAGYLFGK